MRRPLELRPPRPPRWSLLALVASVLLHASLMMTSVEGRLPAPPARRTQTVVLGAPETGRATTMRFRRGSVPAPAGPPVSTARPRPAVAARRDPIVRTTRTPTAVADAEPVRSAAPSDSVSASTLPGAAERIGPELARGRLWVRPLPVPPRELAQRLTRSHVELVDSAVTAVVQAFLDSVAAEPSSEQAKLPEWTTEVAGKKFGLDSRNLYVAGLKIPAAVLALLPLHGGNIDQNKAYNHIMDLRADIQYAAQRAANAEEFKQVIRSIRERKEREREFARSQQELPERTDSTTPVAERAGGAR